MDDNVVRNISNDTKLFSNRLRYLTCRLPALFPLPVAIETADAVPVISAGVVYVAVQRKWNRTATRRDRCRNSWSCTAKNLPAKFYIPN